MFMQILADQPYHLAFLHSMTCTLLVYRVLQLSTWGGAMGGTSSGHVTTFKQ